MPIRLSIVTPDNDALHVEVDEVVAPGIDGEIGFLPGHTQLVTALKPGVVTIIKDKKKSYYATSAGFAEIENDVLTILTHTTEEASEIDVARTNKTLAQAESDQSTMNPDDPNYSKSLRRAARARARLDAASRAR